jgi:hypothetical protein
MGSLNDIYQGFFVENIPVHEHCCKNFIGFMLLDYFSYALNFARDIVLEKTYFLPMRRILDERIWTGIFVIGRFDDIQIPGILQRENISNG